MNENNGTWQRRRVRARSSILGKGEPMIWLTGGMLAISVAMILGLIGLVLAQGLSTFWPGPVVQMRTVDGGTYMGEVSRRVAPTEQDPGRSLLRTGNFRITQTHFAWVQHAEVVDQRHSEPEWAVIAERLEWGRFYGFPEAFVEITFLEGRGEEEVARELRSGGATDLMAVVPAASELALAPLGSGRSVGVASLQRGAEAAWMAFRERHPEVRERWLERRDLEKSDTGAINHLQEKARLDLRRAEQRGEGIEAAQREFEEVRAETQQSFDRIRAEIRDLNAINARHQLLFRTAGEGSTGPRDVLMPLDQIARAYPANRLSTIDKLAIYGSRWFEFLTAEPREANSEGGVFPAIFGTVAMTLVMSLVVVPFGVLAALYLREYARAGWAVSAVRIAVNNLAGVPSIVFGVFGLGFFCYVVGASLDEIFFSAQLPNPTYGKGGLLWASLTLALLTLPVVIVATEEALSAVPNSMREGSYACGASKWQTIQRIVLPRAMPGIITGMILAIARGAGEVAPLMLVGAVKLAPELPIDGIMPFIHPERSFMHLGFHIYDVGFQSQNSEAAKPMVYTTTLLLVGIVALLNLAAVWLRRRLRRRFVTSQF